jgi:hypothetical protein
MTLFSVFFGASCGVGLQLFSNAIRKLPLARGNECIAFSTSNRDYLLIFSTFPFFLKPQIHFITLPSVGLVHMLDTIITHGKKKLSR